MQCTACGTENRRDRRFCHACGVQLSAACPSCGFANNAGDRFCGGCGLDLSAPPAAAAALETERKYVTVVFADIRGSLELIADRDPEEAQAVLDPVLERLVQAATACGGSVNHTRGDGIMALFGAPMAYEDHALRAAMAALAMQRAVGELTASPGWKTDVQILLRIGMHSGEVVVRSGISGLQNDYSAIGETAHIASRVEQLARPGTIALTAQTVKLLAGQAEVVALGPVGVKGLVEPIDLYRLLALRAARSRMRGQPDRPLSRFVGRRLELEALADAVRKGRDGHGQLVTVVGEPGVGKSRLLFEFIRSSHIAGCKVLETGSESFGPTAPMMPVTELARALLGIERGDDPATIGRRLEEGFAGLEEEDRGPIAGAFRALLAAAERDSDARTLGAGAERQYRIIEGIARALAIECRRQPVIVVLEDLHWIDAGSRAFIDLVLEQFRDLPLVVLASYRPDYQPAWGHRSLSQIRLERFSPGEVELFLETLLGPDETLTGLKRDLELQTDGNALFLEESIQALIENHVLAGEPGAYRLAMQPQDFPVPASVQAVLAARIDRLKADEKRILQCAAVIGRRLSHGLLAAIAGIEPEKLDRIVDRLRAGEFLFERRRYPDREYVFKHALTHEVAYATLTQERRRRLHALIFEAMRADAADSFDRTDQLAYHAFRAEQWEQALPRLRRAAASAVARSADADAIRYLDQAVTALSHLPDSGATIEQAIDVRLELRNALMPLGDRARIFRTLVEAEALARRLGDGRRLGWVCGYLTPYLWGLGQYARAQATGEQALEAALANGDSALDVIANRYLGHVHFSVGDYGQAVHRLQTSISTLQDDVVRRHFHLPYKSSIATSAWLASSLTELGRFDEAIGIARQGVSEAEEAGHAYSIAAASCGLGLALLRRGALAEAVPVLERAAELTRTGDFAALSAWITAMLGSAYALGGKLGEARLLLEEGVARMAAMQVRISEASVIAALGETYLLSGRRADAATQADRALAIARERGEHGAEAWVLRLAGEIAVAGSDGDAADAIAVLHASRAIAERLGMRPLQAHCDLGLGRVLRRAGDATAAQACLSRAAGLYREMGMQHWLPIAENTGNSSAQATPARPSQLR